LEEKETVAGVAHGGPIMPKERTPEGRPVVWLARARRRRGEEGGLVGTSKVVCEDAGEDASREEVRKQEVVAVDDGTPRAADAAGLGERAAWQTAEDVEEQVVGEAGAVAVAVGPVHLAGRRADRLLGDGADRSRGRLRSCDRQVERLERERDMIVVENSSSSAR
jgi:hypothetical protein